jgi:hypothetical protein
MPRARTHCTWRTVENAVADTSTDAQLQTLERTRKGELHWVTVARGRAEDVIEIAKALNRARFTLFDIRPAATEKRR